MVRNEIKVLDKDTIDQIAAGEVIERPSSIVKELVENSIDAGATAISVEIKKGGTSEIRITDNGSGIPADQIHTAFLRHATSKLRQAKELESIHSLGFRGEALSSIAAVSMVTLITKSKDEVFGSEFRIEGGIDGVLSEIGAPDGTTFIVKNLFYNTPARKKFLKSDQTETTYIQTLMEHIALSNPSISIRFAADGRERLQTSGNGQIKDVIYQIYGRDILKNLLPVSVENEYFTMEGFLGNYSVNRGNRDFENFFVNGRLVEDKILRKAVEEGYRGFLMQHQFPFATLFFTFPDGSIDVNVHPQKKEIRIHNGLMVQELLTEAVHERLTRREDIIDVEMVKEKDQKTPIISAEPFEEKHLEQVKRAVEDHAKTEVEKCLPEEIPVTSKAPVMTEESEMESFQSKNSNESKSFTSRDVDYLSQPVTKTRELDQMCFLSEETKPYYRIIGQIFQTYWIFEWNERVYILDQHAAHEKVNYERFMKALAEKSMTSQMVSPPIIVTLTNQEMNAMEKHREDLEALGYRFESFGGHEYQLSGIPGNLYDIDEKRLFMDLAAQAVDWKMNEESQLIRERVATISCKASIKGNQQISEGEIRILMDELLALQEPYHCPHGRPTMVALTRDELDKMFKRIVS